MFPFFASFSYGRLVLLDHKPDWNVAPSSPTRLSWGKKREADPPGSNSLARLPGSYKSHHKDGRKCPKSLTSMVCLSYLTSALLQDPDVVIRHEKVTSTCQDPKMAPPTFANHTSVCTWQDTPDRENLTRQSSNSALILENRTCTPY